MKRAFNIEDLNKLFISKDGKVYRMISYSEYPTVTLESLENKERLHLVVRSLITEEFEELKILENDRK